MRVLDETDMRWVSGGSCSNGHADGVEIGQAIGNYEMYRDFAAMEKQWLDNHNSGDPDWQYYTNLYNQDLADSNGWKAEANILIEENNNYYFLLRCDGAHSYVNPIP